MTDESTAIAQRAPLAAGTNKNVQAIVPKDIEQVFRLATAIARADMAPKGFERNQEKIAVAMIHGMEVGLTPMAALQSIAVINGNPTIWGDGALGLVRGSGLLEDMDETIEGTGDKMVASCTLKRVGQKTPIVRTFGVEDAKAADLWGKKGPWQTYPQRMLKMRARSWALRDGFADVLRGLSIREEVHDMGELVETGDGTYAPRPTRGDKPLRQHYVEQHEAERRAAMEAELAGATNGQMPDTPEERGEVEEVQAEAPDPNADPDGYLKWLGEEAAKCETPKSVDRLEQLEDLQIQRLAEAHKGEAATIFYGRRMALA